MKNSIAENEIEEIALGYLQSLGYSYLNGLVISADGEHPKRQYPKYKVKKKILKN